MGRHEKKRHYTARRAPHGALRQGLRRDIGPADPVFIDPRFNTPAVPELDDLQREIVAAMHRARISPDLIYAYIRTGLIVTEDNQRYISTEDLDAWNDAIAEYCEHHKKSSH
jgi:hypothetical protein